MKKILIVEDEEEITDIITLVLQRAGYMVDSLTAFGEYQNKIYQFLPDLILLDLNLGGSDGADISRFVKAQPELKHIPVVLMSANMDIRQAMVQAQSDAFLSKPFDIADLIGTTESLLANKVSDMQ